jgi:hypothetical protein
MDFNQMEQRPTSSRGRRNDNSDFDQRGAPSSRGNRRNDTSDFDQRGAPSYRGNRRNDTSDFDQRGAPSSRGRRRSDNPEFDQQRAPSSRGSRGGRNNGNSESYGRSNESNQRDTRSKALSIAMGGQAGQPMSNDDKIRARQAAALSGSFEDMRLDNQRMRGGDRGSRGRGSRGLVGSGRGQQRRQRPAFFEEYLGKDEIEQGLEDGSLMKGVLRINKRNQHDSYVTVAGVSRDYYVFQQKMRNRALDGDLVVIALLLGKQRENEVGRKKDKMDERREDNAERMKKCQVDDEEVAIGDGEMVAESLEDVLFSKVVAIESGPGQSREFTGTLEKPNDGDKNMMFKPRDKRVPLIMIPVGKLCDWLICRICTQRIFRRS